MLAPVLSHAPQVYASSLEAATKQLQPVLQCLTELDTTLASVVDDVSGVRGKMHDVRTKQEALGLYGSGNAAATANSIEITVRGCAYVPALAALSPLPRPCPLDTSS